MPNYLGQFGFQYEGLLFSDRRTRPLGRLPTCFPVAVIFVNSGPLPILSSSHRDSVRTNVGVDNLLINFVSKKHFCCGRYEQRELQVNVKGDRECEA
jgi:hypothetical protein